MPGTESGFAFPPVGAGPTPGQMATRNSIEDFFGAAPYVHMYRNASHSTGLITWQAQLGRNYWDGSTTVTIPDEVEGGYVVSLGLFTAAGDLEHNGLVVARTPSQSLSTPFSGAVVAGAYVYCKRGDTLRARITLGTSAGGEYNTYLLARRVV